MLRTYAQILSFHLIDLLPRPPSQTRPRSLLLIRLDAIGDYVLSRNFFSVLARSPRFDGYHITLLGNAAWKELSLALDTDAVHEWIWLDRRLFIESPLYRYRKLKEITARGFEVVVSPIQSRDFYTIDWIVHTVQAREKLGSSGDLANLTAHQKKVSDRWYTRLIPAPAHSEFEFYRNREFFAQLLGQPLSIRGPTIPTHSLRTAAAIALPSRYAVFFLGGGAQFRKWSVRSYARVAQHLRTQHRMAIVVAGGPADVGDARLFVDACGGDIHDLVGRTTLVELLGVISGCQLLLSNETSAPHLAMALAKRVLVISNGNHFGRFTPYPPEMGNRYHAVFHPEIEHNIGDVENLVKRFGPGSRLNIDDIRIETVIARTDALLAPAYGDATGPLTNFGA